MYLPANYGGQDGGQNVLTRQLWWPGWWPGCTYPPTMVARMYLPANYGGHDGGDDKDEGGHHPLGGDQRDLDTAAAPGEVKYIA